MIWGALIALGITSLIALWDIIRDVSQLAAQVKELKHEVADLKKLAQIVGGGGKKP